MVKRNLSDRRYIVIIVFILVGVVFILKLLHIQVMDDTYILSAESNVLRRITQYPSRGIIFDRNGVILVYDEAAYDIMVVPGQVSRPDTLRFCRIFNISDTVFRERMTRAKKYSYYKPSVFISQITKEEFGFIQDQMYKFPGFFVQSRSLRRYPHAVAAHTLGYIGEVNDAELRSDTYYRMGDYIGKSGIEKSYEKELRGQKGVKIVMVDVHNREQGTYRGGRYDTASNAGTNLYLTIDFELQKYAELLMENKTGSVVAIEPASGEILALVTSPGYNPNLLVGRARGKNFTQLTADSLKPLINRAVLGTYPPGSTYKMINALIGMQEGVLTPSMAYSCYGTASSPIRCTHSHYSPLELQQAIEHSCNPYFWNVFRSVISNPAYASVKEAYNAWRNHNLNMGFGKKFGTDILFEVSGNIPTAEFFDNIYGEKRWNALTIRSLAIGQGEILFTPLQLANMVVIIANNGFYYPPHLVGAIESSLPLSKRVFNKQQCSVQPGHFDVVQQAMLDVFEGAHGTARWAKLPDVQICGKTGTVQNPHGKDHSLFVAFAPKDNPRIALSVVVENAGYGSTWAAPIASLLVEKYLHGEIARPAMEQRILDAVLNIK